MLCKLLILSVLASSITHCRGVKSKPTKLLGLSTANLKASAPADHLNNRSPRFLINRDDASIHMNVTGEAIDGTKIAHLGIHTKALSMIDKAERYILVSSYLLDVFEPKASEKTYELVQTLIDQKKRHPELTLALVLDPINRRYADHISPQLQLLLDAGADIFFTDLNATPNRARQDPIAVIYQDYIENPSNAVPLVKAATNRTLQKMILRRFLDWRYALPFPTTYQIDGLSDEAQTPQLEEDTEAVQSGQALITQAQFAGQVLTADMLLQLALLKANQRSLLVVDRPQPDSDRGFDFEALVASASLHPVSNTSLSHAVSIGGDAAKFVYSVIRTDIMHSIERYLDLQTSDQGRALSQQFARWSNKSPDRVSRYVVDELKPVFLEPSFSTQGTKAEAQILTEGEITRALLKALTEVEDGDTVRIQMHRLAKNQIIDAIITTANKPGVLIQIILDDNLKSESPFSGTPNQVAAKSLNLGGKDQLKIRWFNGKSKLNEAKIISITNQDTGKYWIMTGSADWTSRSLGLTWLDNVEDNDNLKAFHPANLEANITLNRHASAVQEFNRTFDSLWDNRDPYAPEREVAFTRPYSTDPSKVSQLPFENGEQHGNAGW